jgi:hypothetical protein
MTHSQSVETLRTSRSTRAPHIRHLTHIRHIAHTTMTPRAALRLATTQHPVQHGRGNGCKRCLIPSISPMMTSTTLDPRSSL